MPKEPNWHKHVAIGTYILIALTILLTAIATFPLLHPVDAEHPLNLDSLSKPLPLPRWLASAIVILGIVVSSLLTWRWTRRAGSIHVLEERLDTNALDMTSLLEIHVPSLDERPTSPGGVFCPAKLRFSLKNISDRPIHVFPPQMVDRGRKHFPAVRHRPISWPSLYARDVGDWIFLSNGIPWIMEER